ncbi:MAG: hypothetical protein ACFFFH_01015, partial [Candidatus Thorarchaeota archaeon]
NLGYILLKTGDNQRAWEFFLQASDYFKKKKNWEELITLGSNFRNELILTQDFEKAITVLHDFILPAVKKSQDKKIENQYHYEIALFYHLKGDTDLGLEYWKRSYNKKVTFQKYSAPILKSIRDTNTKKELEKQHLRFLKQIIELKKSK